MGDTWEEKLSRSKCVKGFMDLLIMAILRNAEMSGYDIITYIYDSFKVLLSPGTVYPALSSLERKGLVTSSISGRKRVYKLTPLGEAVGETLSSAFSSFHVQIRAMWGAGTTKATPSY